MKALVVIASVRGTDNFGKYAINFSQHKHDVDFLIVDEDWDNRKTVAKQLDAYKTDFYGHEERNAWFNAHNLAEYKSVIPSLAHNENSFGLLVALERSEYDMIVFVDDDTYPIDDADFLGEHWKALNTKTQVRKTIGGNWLNTHPNYQVRGMPYFQRRRRSDWNLPNLFSETILNMGCWNGIPDLNAIDYLALNPEPQYISPHNFTAAPHNFVPVCSMNVSFKPEIISAYYQLWHRDRFDDIFSGLFLKVIADHLEKGLSVGAPVCFHDKAERNYFKDAETELPSMLLNEELWKVLLEIQLSHDTWHTCYRELAQQLKQKAKHLSPHYITQMADKMLLWSDLTEKVTVAT